MKQLVHHWRLLWQYRSAWKGIMLVLKTGEHVGLRYQPRVGETTWVAGDGREIDSDQILAVIDRSAYGYG